MSDLGVSIARLIQQIALAAVTEKVTYSSMLSCKTERMPWIGPSKESNSESCTVQNLRAVGLMQPASNTKSRRA